MPTTSSKAKVKSKTRVSQRVSQKQVVVVQVPPEKKTRRRRRKPAPKKEEPRRGSIYQGAVFYSTNAQDPNIGRMYSELRDTLNEIQSMKDKAQNQPIPVIPPIGLDKINKMIGADLTTPSTPLLTPSQSTYVPSSLGFTTPVVSTAESERARRPAQREEERALAKKGFSAFIPTDVSSSEQEKYIKRRELERAKFRAGKKAQERAMKSASESASVSSAPSSRVPPTTNVSSIERQIRAGTYNRKPTKATIDKLGLIQTAEGKWVMPDMVQMQFVRS